MDNEYCEDKAVIVSSHDVVCDKEYCDWVRQLKESYRQAKAQATIRVNVERLAWYWRMGRELVARKAEATWGKGVVEQLSLDLRHEFPGESGLSADNLWAMKRWYLFYATRCTEEKLAQAVQELQSHNIQCNKLLVRPVQVLEEGCADLLFPQMFSLIPWGHHLDIVRKSGSLEEALFYVQSTISNGWSRPALNRQIEGRLYQKSGGAVTNFAELLPVDQAQLAQEITKESYDLGFLTLPSDYAERELEEQLEQHISRFLLELGNGFSFVGRQKELIVDGVTRRIDMLFYHLRLHCYVVVELKAQRFQPEFAGKLNFYVNAVDDLLRTEVDNPTIGLLICSDMRRTEVKYSFKGLNTPIGVAKYGNVQISDILDQLPTEKMLQDSIQLLQRDDT